MDDLSNKPLSTFMSEEPTPLIVDHKQWASLSPSSPPPPLSSELLSKFRKNAPDKRRGCIILAGGKGTRFASDVPKIISPCNGQPLGSRAINAVLAHDIPIVVVIGWDAQKVCSELGKSLSHEQAAFVIQEKQMGTGHAVAVGLHAFGENFDGNLIIMCGDSGGVDNQLVGDLVKDFEKMKQIGATILTGSRKAAGSGADAYGRIVRTDKRSKGDVIDIVEKKQIVRMSSDAERKYEHNGKEIRYSKDELNGIDEFNSGIYIVKAGLLRDAASRTVPSQTKQDPPAYEYYATDFVKNLVSSGSIVQGSKIDDQDIWKLEGANTVEELRELERKIRSEKR